MIDLEKSTRKTPTAIQEESSQETRSGGPFPPLGETVNQTPTANSTLNDEKLGEAPLTIRTGNRCPLSSLALNIKPALPKAARERRSCTDREGRGKTVFVGR